MLPKSHIILGFIFSFSLYFLFPQITLFNLSLIFLASFLIDFDHYLWYVFQKKEISLKKSYLFLKNNEKLKRKLMLFHTLEFHILVFLLGFLWSGFHYILIGMIFHSLMDIVSLTYERRLNYRIFSFINYLIKDN